MYELGIIGGMGPAAGVNLLDRLIKYTKASIDQEHIKAILLNEVNIPDRTTCIINKTDEVSPIINNCFKVLSELNVKRVILGCNTVHYFQDQFIIPENIEFISFKDTVNKHLLEKYPNKKMLLLSTVGTVISKIYIHPLIKTLDQEEQEVISKLINDTKANNEVEVNSFINLINKYKDEYIILLGCTEISIYKDLCRDARIIDLIDILIINTIQKCNYQLKEGVENYI